MNTKLNKTFNVPDMIKEDEEGFIHIEIPENASLADIKNIALQAFQEQIKILTAIDPKYRQRYLEVANQFLNTAVMAESKSEDIRLKDEKNSKDKEDDKPKEGKISRKELELWAREQMDSMPSSANNHKH